MQGRCSGRPAVFAPTQISHRPWHHQRSYEPVFLTPCSSVTTGFHPILPESSPKTWPAFESCCQSFKEYVRIGEVGDRIHHHVGSECELRQVFLTRPS